MFHITSLEYNELTTYNKWPYYDITRPFSMIYFVVSGKGEYRIKDKTFPFKKNHFYIVPANFKISLITDNKDPLFLTFIHTFISPQLNYVSELDAENNPFLKQIASMVRENIRNPDTIYMRKLIELLVSYSHEIHENSTNSLSFKVKQYIDQEYINVFKNNDLDVKFNYSNSYIVKKFKATYSQTPKQYALQLLMIHIIDLLKNGCSINEISDELEFSSPENFSRFFKNYYGCPPSQILKHPQESI